MWIKAFATQWRRTRGLAPCWMEGVTSQLLLSTTARQPDCLWLTIQPCHVSYCWVTRYRLAIRSPCGVFWLASLTSTARSTQTEAQTQIADPLSEVSSRCLRGSHSMALAAGTWFILTSACSACALYRDCTYLPACLPACLPVGCGTIQGACVFHSDTARGTAGRSSDENQVSQQDYSRNLGTIIDTIRDEAQTTKLVRMHIKFADGTAVWLLYC